MYTELDIEFNTPEVSRLTACQSLTSQGTLRRQWTGRGGRLLLRQALVIGAGIAGISAALSLADRGIFVNIIDSEGAIGGRARELACKGVDKCVRCDVCLVTDSLYNVGKSQRIRIFPNSTLKNVSGEPGRFRVTIDRRPRYIDEAKCTACGACIGSCPVDGSAIRPPDMGVPLTYMIDPTRCLSLNDQDCSACFDACSNGAVDLSMKPSTKRMEVGTIIVATGFEPFDPILEPRYRYDELPGVITSLDAERLMNLEGKLPSADGENPRTVAFIQCVGSRDQRLGAEYCSKVCCKYSRGIAANLREIDPQAEITFFIMDWRPYELVEDDIFAWEAIDEKVRVVRARPAEIISSDSAKPQVRYVFPSENMIEEEFDLVILSIGIRPPYGLDRMAGLLGLDITPTGFLWTSSERPSLTSRLGIFASGCCTGPKDIEESAMEGTAAAGEAASFLEGLK
ncbi:MAG: CoB--CoM heterodisulfide reductase iron-sulfur subunit A family protein [Methanomassiliicoccales archaeon]|nr:CoB--CoM heterodisulfide reductase iron-sulfur subunit A family protein [Methanomassiliicoccales archaeon]NYT15032.1 CoB--CoM heterodisulfide reductase iron-sulfur subunit A family protein [Methanomassiliicoccales archaeon]